MNFHTYDSLVTNIYGPPTSLVISRIRNDLLSEITNAIADGTIKECCIASLYDNNYDHLLLRVDAFQRPVIEKLNSNQNVLDLHRLDSSNLLLSKIHEEIRQLFSNDVGAPFVIVNSRMWVTKPNGEEQGPNAFHKDGFEPGHMKVMIYITPLSKESGYFEFKFKEEIQRVNNLPAGTALLFENSKFIHRGVPGTIYSRIAIEITLMRSTADYGQAWSGHFFGRHLYEPAIFHHAKLLDEEAHFNPHVWRFTKINSKLKVNIGSGRRKWEGWTCFDELSHDGVTKIVFGPQVQLPLCDESTSLLYSSHCFEHLDDSTLRTLLSEMRRVISPDGLFILKIPDYEYFLKHYRNGSASVMNGKGIEKVIKTWRGRIEDNLLSRVAMMFCSYWNKAYGDHFSGAITSSSEAYHGPPIASAETLQEIFLSESPRLIAQRLCTLAKSDSDFHRFNHQNAWSRNEMHTFLSESGFRVVSTSMPLIRQRFGAVIPDISFMQSWSAYFLVRPD